MDGNDAQQLVLAFYIAQDGDFVSKVMQCVFVQSSPYDSWPILEKMFLHSKNMQATYNWFILDETVFSQSFTQSKFEQKILTGLKFTSTLP